MKSLFDSNMSTNDSFDFKTPKDFHHRGWLKTKWLSVKYYTLVFFCCQTFVKMAKCALIFESQKNSLASLERPSHLYFSPNKDFCVSQICWLILNECVPKVSFTESVHHIRVITKQSRHEYKLVYSNSLYSFN